jgi:hypothetical protein
LVLQSSRGQLGRLDFSGLRFLAPLLFGGAPFDHGAFPWFGDMPLSPNDHAGRAVSIVDCLYQAAAAD